MDVNCEEFRTLLDAYVDGELSEAKVDAMLEHTKNCADCARELESAALLRDTLAHIDDDVAVPLEAQAAWRKAIRREAGAKSAKKRMRIFYAAAAALVVALGCTAAFRGGRLAGPVKNEPMLRAETAVVVSDGMEPAARETACTARRRIAAKDVEAACETLEALCAEYGAAMTAEETQADGAARVFRIELPYDSMEDFLSATAQLGAVLDTETYEEAPETATIELQIQEE